MTTLGDNVFDSGLDYVDANASHVYICSQEPATYAEAITTYALGNKSGLTISAPADRAGGGREITVSAIAAGTVTATGTASHFAVVYATGSELLATKALAAPQVVTSGNTWTLTAFTIGIPDPA